MPLKYNPARLVAAVGVFIQSVLLVIAYATKMTPELLILLEGVQTAGLGVAGVVYVEARSASIAGLEDLVALAAASHPPIHSALDTES